MCRSKCCPNPEGGNQTRCQLCQHFFQKIGTCVNVRCTNRRVPGRKDGMCWVCNGKVHHPQQQCVGREDCFNPVDSKAKDPHACSEHQDRLNL